jgi:hypothetical protein
VKAVLRNVDAAEAVGRHPARRVEEVGGVRVFVTHQIDTPDRMPPRVAGAVAKPRAKVVVFGHSHTPYNDRHEGVLFLNPGGAGPRRLGLPRSVGLLHIGGGAARAEIVYLDGGRA